MRESLLTAQEVAELLGVPSSWVYEQSRAGRIPTVTLGRYRRYRWEAIGAWLHQLEAERPVAGHTRFGCGVTPGRHERRSVAADSVRVVGVGGPPVITAVRGGSPTNVRIRSE